METTTQEQVVNVELGGRASSSKQIIQQKTIDQVFNFLHINVTDI